MGLEISTAGDVYSYGVILLEMITGRRPTDGPFEGGRSLRGLVQGALPRDVREVLDGGLVVVPPHHDDGDGDKAIILGCVERLAELGLRCAADSPGDRPTIGRGGRGDQRSIFFGAGGFSGPRVAGQAHPAAPVRLLLVTARSQENIIN